MKSQQIDKNDIKNSGQPNWATPVKTSSVRKSGEFRRTTFLNDKPRETSESSCHIHVRSCDVPNGLVQNSSRTERTVFDHGDRKLLLGTRLSVSELISRHRHAAVLLQPTKNATSSSSMRLVVFGGESFSIEDQNSILPSESHYLECDIDLLEQPSLNWRSVNLIPPIEYLTSHSMVTLTSPHDSDKCIVLGGSHSASIFSTLYVIDTTEHRSYAAMTTGQCPASRSEHSCNISQSMIYIFGGRTKPFSIDYTKRRSDITNKNEVSRKDISHQYFLQSCKVFNDFWKLDLRDFEWVNLFIGRKGPCGRAGHCSVVSGCYMLIYGGFDGEHVLDDLWLFNLKTEEWKLSSFKGRSPGRRYASASCLMNDKWMIHGGITEQGSILNDFCVFDLITFSASRVRVDVHNSPPRLLPSLAFHVICQIQIPIKSEQNQNSLSAVLLIGGYGKCGRHCNAVYLVCSANEVFDAAKENEKILNLFPTTAELTAGTRNKESNADFGEATPMIVSRGTQNEKRNDEISRLRARNDYLAARLFEQKFENLQLRSLTRESAFLRDRLADTEAQLSKFTALQRHSLLGPILKCMISQAAIDNNLYPNQSSPFVKQELLKQKNQQCSKEVENCDSKAPPPSTEFQCIRCLSFFEVSSIIQNEELLCEKCSKQFLESPVT